MPRDSNGNFTLSAGVNPVVTGTTITASWANTTMTDIAQGLTDSLDRSGRGGMLASFKVADGSAAAPGLAFNNETTTGFFRQGSGAMGIALLGTERARFTASGLDLLVTQANTDDTTKAASTAFVHNILPLGSIIMWNGTVATIPSGWALCNGTGGTPDLRDKFIVGATSDDVGVAKTNITGALTQTGGTKDAVVVSHTHTASLSGTTSGHSVDHSHTFSGTSGAMNSNQAHTHGLNIGTGAGAIADVAQQTNSPGAATVNTNSTNIDHTHNFSGTTSGTSANHTHTVTTTGTTDAAGSSGTNQNLPPYYALCFIMKTTG